MSKCALRPNQPCRDHAAPVLMRHAQASSCSSAVEPSPSNPSAYPVARYDVHFISERWFSSFIIASDSFSFTLCRANDFIFFIIYCYLVYIFDRRVFVSTCLTCLHCSTSVPFTTARRNPPGGLDCDSGASGKVICMLDTSWCSAIAFSIIS